jgi:hypothetical protein
MHASIREPFSSLRRILPGTAALVAMSAAGDAVFAVMMIDQTRSVGTFATLDSVDGEDLFSNDSMQSTEPGTFDQEALCHVGVPGDQATSSAHQLSYLAEDGILAEGNMSGQAEISAASSFAEGFGMSRLVSTFSVDGTTTARFQASLFASGNGSTNFVFRHLDGAILVHRSLQDGSDSFDETLALEPGTYELTVVSSGYGQALPGGGGEPAFGSWSMSATFGGSTDAASFPAGGNGRTAPVVVPNPVRGAARILPASRDVDDALVITDVAGRVVRRFDLVRGSGVTWDTRDASGRPVAAGVYLVRTASGGAAARAIVVR